MALTNDGQACQILLVEPNRPDAHWLEIMLEEARVPRVIFYYSTGMAALAAYGAGKLVPIDGIVVAERLPMLTTQEFVDGVRAVNDDVPIVVLGESLSPFLQLPSGCVRFAKPLSNKDMQSFWHVVSRRHLQRQQKHAA